MPDLHPARTRCRRSPRRPRPRTYPCRGAPRLVPGRSARRRPEPRPTSRRRAPRSIRGSSTAGSTETTAVAPPAGLGEELGDAPLQHRSIGQLHLHHVTHRQRLDIGGLDRELRPLDRGPSTRGPAPLGAIRSPAETRVTPTRASLSTKTTSPRSTPPGHGDAERFLPAADHLGGRHREGLVDRDPSRPDHARARRDRLRAGRHRVPPRRHRACGTQAGNRRARPPPDRPARRGHRRRPTRRPSGRTDTTVPPATEGTSTGSVWTSSPVASGLDQQIPTLDRGRIAAGRCFIGRRLQQGSWGRTGPRGR